jgi:hypothetical protein
MQLALTLALTRILGKLFSYINQPQVRPSTTLLSAVVGETWVDAAVAYAPNRTGAVTQQTQQLIRVRSPTSWVILHWQHRFSLD